jgi:hypothetical protein
VWLKLRSLAGRIPTRIRTACRLRVLQLPQAIIEIARVDRPQKAFDHLRQRKPFSGGDAAAPRLDQPVYSGGAAVARWRSNGAEPQGGRTRPRRRSDGKRLCLDRTVAPQRDRSVELALPPINSAADILGAIKAVADTVDLDSFLMLLLFPAEKYQSSLHLDRSLRRPASDAARDGIACDYGNVVVAA